MSGKWVLCAETHLTNRGNLHNGRTFDQLSTDRNEDTLYPCLLQIVCGSAQLHLVEEGIKWVVVKTQVRMNHEPDPCMN